MSTKFSFQKGYRARAAFVIFNTIFFIVMMICMIVPILKILSDSLTNATVFGVSLLPKANLFTLGGYKYILTNSTLRTPFLVSVYTTIMTTIVGLALSTISAYVLIQKEMPGVKIFSYLLMFTMIFNGGLIPTYLVIQRVGLLDTYWAVILTTSVNVYNFVLMRSFFEQLPTSLFEAAEIDGCTPMGIFIKIVLPLSKAALASIGLFFAVAAWSEYFHYVLYFRDTSKANFQCKLRELVDSSSDQTVAGEGAVDPNTIKNATVIVSIVPFMFIYPFCQKYFMTGVTMGAVKE